MRKQRKLLIGCLLAFSLLLVRIWFAQTALAQNGCPSVGQIVEDGQPDHGLQGGSNVTIYVVGSLSAGDAQLTNAAADWTRVPNANFTFNVKNVSSVPSGTASASNPVITF